MELKEVYDRFIGQDDASKIDFISTNSGKKYSGAIGDWEME